MLKDSVGSGWTFLTNHSHVLVCLLRDPSMRLRDVADQVGITERAVQRIIVDLVEAKVVSIGKQGRRNSYSIDLNAPLRHACESGQTVGDLLHFIVRTDAP